MLLSAAEPVSAVDSSASQLLARKVLICVFALSGFSGLIYEHIWTHYLKLFLGHAAYAQTLVLGIFMGGLAVGAWLSARYSQRWSNALQVYAITEGAIGLFGLVFHATFVWAIATAYSSVFPWLESPMAITLFKWALSGCLILPQSILLGMTFPLMSTSLIRRFPGSSGATVAILYFTNSLGAAVGVLVSGFWLVAEVGLPGAILTAALLNIVVALIAWLVAKSAEPRPNESWPMVARTISQTGSLSWLLLGVACFTGVASFIYEISWIRMLNLVLGSSTHSFEVMLSSFILGLALGGLWIKRRIGEISDSVRYLGVIQLVMGLLALSTIALYPQLFGAMQAVMDSLGRTSGGYFLFNVISFLLSLGLMLPATFCAGMTLPLLTQALMQHQYGEKSVGHVYAVNTLGAIIGVFAATHIGMPMLGLKGLVTAGAVVDIVLGVTLFWYVRRSPISEWAAGVVATVALSIGFASFVVEWNPIHMASGVYRHGVLLPSEHVSVPFHKDGKTSTVDIVKLIDGSMSIRTNGKVDAALQMDGRRVTSDEDTMVIAAALPMALNPKARVVANIGFGSGLTSHVLLGNNSIERLDTIEIEPAMVEGAQRFRPRVEAVYSDPRSHIYIEDARTFFSTRHSKYDIIISEPSNPWVSGVASLFTDEFYRAIRTHLNESGVLVQWFQVYEMDPPLVFSVLQAVNNNFSRSAMYSAPGGSDILILASNGGNVSAPSGEIFKYPSLKKELEPFAIKTAEDLALLRVADRDTLIPLLMAFNTPVNSEYFPFLDLNASRSRFMRQSASEIVNMVKAPVPLIEMIERTALPFDAVVSEQNVKHFRTSGTQQARQAQLYLLNNGTIGRDEPAPALLRDLALIRLHLFKCDDSSRTDRWLDALFNVGDKVNVFQTAAEAGRFWNGIERSPCFPSLNEAQRLWISLLKAVGARQADDMVVIAERLLAMKTEVRENQQSYLLMAGMTGALVQHDGDKAAKLWGQYKQRILQGRQPSMVFQLLVAHSLVGPPLAESFTPQSHVSLP